MSRSGAKIRPFRPGDEKAARHVCLKTGDHGGDGEPLYRDDPEALSRIYVDPYLAFEPGLAFMLEDDDGVCGYALGALDAEHFFQRYDREWRPALCKMFPPPEGRRSDWSRADHIHYQYHHPDYFIPGAGAQYPSHLHIDLLPRAQGRGFGRAMIERLLQALRDVHSPGVHLGMSARNERAERFYRKLGFRELERTGEGEDAAIYLGLRLEEGPGDA